MLGRWNKRKWVQKCMVLVGSLIVLSGCNEHFDMKLQELPAATNVVQLPAPAPDRPFYMTRTEGREMIVARVGKLPAQVDADVLKSSTMQAHDQVLAALKPINPKQFSEFQKALNAMTEGAVEFEASIKNDQTKYEYVLMQRMLFTKGTEYLLSIPDGKRGIFSSCDEAGVCNKYEMTQDGTNHIKDFIQKYLGA